MSEGGKSSGAYEKSMAMTMKGEDSSSSGDSQISGLGK